MKTIYVRSYYGSHAVGAVPPAKLVANVEQAIPMLHPHRTHILTAPEPNLTLHNGELRSSIGWIVTIVPEGGEK